jgi:hypothetical protein
MGEQIRQQLSELFSAKQSGGMRAFLFSQFYEDLLRQYFNNNEYNVYQGKPKIHWNKIEIPSTIHGENCLKLVNRLKKLQQKSSHCIPDGLFVRNGQYFVWEAKNWVQELYPSPFREHA